MSKPSLRLHLTKLVLYHSLLWQLGQWPQSKFHCNADNEYPLPDNEVSALQNIMSNSEFRQDQNITKQYCQDANLNHDFTIKCSCYNKTKACRISKISMTSLDLTGTIHESVGYLSKLQSLELSNNKLHGGIPDTLGNLMYLETLDLSYNQLSGQIPASLGDWGSLEYLFLGYNLLSGAIPQSFGSLKNLRQLNLQVNRLSGSIPRAFEDFPNLTTIVLSENRFTGPLPESLGNVTSLTTFYVSANYLSGEIPDTYGQLTNLTRFSIAGNYISGRLPVKTIAKWTNIYYLALLGNNFEGILTEEIFNLPNLKYLRISDLANGGFPLPLKINYPANFVELTLSNCSITGPIPKYIGDMSSLSHLDLSFNHLTDGLPQTMSPSIIYISFSENMLNGTIPRWIIEASQISTDLSFNNFSAIDSAVPSNPQLNLFACCRNSSTTVPERMDPFEMKNTYCPENKPKFHSLFSFNKRKFKELSEEGFGVFNTIR